MNDTDDQKLNSDFRALRDSRYPVHRIADQLEPYLRAIVKRFHPEKIILFGSQAYGEPVEDSDVDLLVVRRDLGSERRSNLEIYRALDDLRGANLSFTVLSRSPERLHAEIAAGSSFHEEILSRGVTLYAA